MRIPDIRHEVYILNRHKVQTSRYEVFFGSRVGRRIRYASGSTSAAVTGEFISDRVISIRRAETSISGVLAIVHIAIGIVVVVTGEETQLVLDDIAMNVKGNALRSRRDGIGTTTNQRSFGILADIVDESFYTNRQCRRVVRDITLGHSTVMMPARLPVQTLIVLVQVNNESLVEEQRIYVTIEPFEARSSRLVTATVSYQQVISEVAIRIRTIQTNTEVIRRRTTDIGDRSFNRTIVPDFFRQTGEGRSRLQTKNEVRSFKNLFPTNVGQLDKESLFTIGSQITTGNVVGSRSGRRIVSREVIFSCQQQLRRELGRDIIIISQIQTTELEGIPVLRDTRVLVVATTVQGVTM